jgi:RES domain
MSSPTWTRAALSSDARAASGRCWRIVEAQHHVSTAKLTDTMREQERLEQLLEASKPAVPEDCRSLNYLLFTPFRYGAPYPKGSRFRRAGLTAGVFYASEFARTAAIEMAFHRLLFFAESPTTPWPTNPGEYTVFAVEYGTGRALDLMAAPFNAHVTALTHPTDYSHCQSLADACREQDIDVIRYQSTRDPQAAANIAILRCRAFASPEPIDRQTWRIQLNGRGARIICEFPKFVLDLERNTFAADPRIAKMRWAR